VRVLYSMNPQKVVRLYLLSAALAIPAAVSFAQDSTSQPPPPVPAAPDASPGEGAQPPPHRRRGGYSLEDLTQKLSLTADQQKSVGAAINSGRDQMKALRDDDSLSDDDKRAKGRELMAATKAQIRALLTPDQQAIFDKLPTRGQRPPPPPADGSAPANPPPSDSSAPANPPPANGAPPAGSPPSS
jgi:Spy/CpxP family protein refolding chaperone